MERAVSIYVCCGGHLLWINVTYKINNELINKHSTYITQGGGLWNTHVAQTHNRFPHINDNSFLPAGIASSLFVCVRACVCVSVCVCVCVFRIFLLFAFFAFVLKLTERIPPPSPLSFRLRLPLPLSLTCSPPPPVSFLIFPFIQYSFFQHKEGKGRMSFFVCSAFPLVNKKLTIHQTAPVNELWNSLSSTPLHTKCISSKHVQEVLSIYIPVSLYN